MLARHESLAAASAIQLLSSFRGEFFRFDMEDNVGFVELEELKRLVNLSH